MSTDKKDIIINVAQGLFAKYGLNKTTVDEIAKEAHMGKSSIYHYFETKEDIFRVVMEQERAAYKEGLMKAVEAAATPQDKLRSYVLTRMEHLKHMANYYSALRDEYLEHYVFIEEVRKDSLAEEVNMVKSILREGVVEKVFLIRDVDLTALAIITSLKGLEYPWAVKIQMPAVKKSIEALLEILFHGIVRR